MLANTAVLEPSPKGAYFPNWYFSRAFSESRAAAERLRAS
jgi:hypothetical protein